MHANLKDSPQGKARVQGENKLENIRNIISIVEKET